MDLTKHMWRSIFTWPVYWLTLCANRLTLSIDVVDERFILQISQSTDSFLKQKKCPAGELGKSNKEEGNWDQSIHRCLLYILWSKSIYIRKCYFFCQLLHFCDQVTIYTITSSAWTLCLQGQVTNEGVYWKQAIKKPDTLQYLVSYNIWLPETGSNRRPSD